MQDRHNNIRKTINQLLVRSVIYSKQHDKIANPNYGVMTVSGRDNMKATYKFMAKLYLNLHQACKDFWKVL
jgi:hypothetical protein